MSAYRRALAIAAVVAVTMGGWLYARPASAEALAIRDIVVRSTTGRTATVAWTTNVPSWGEVTFGIDPGRPDRSFRDDRFLTERELTLIGLSPETTYFLTVTARTPGPDEVSAFPISFRTTRLTEAEEREDERRQLDPEAIDYVGIDAVTASAVAVSWRSSVDTRGQLAVQSYPTPGRRPATAYDGAYGKFHQLVVGNLATNQTYEATITMWDRDNVSTVRGPIRFTTSADTQAERALPTITAVGPASSRDRDIGDRTAVISFTTSHLASAWVNVRELTARRGQVVREEVGMRFQHRIPLADLKPDTEYEYVIAATDMFRRGVTLPARRFRTAATPTAAGRVLGVAVGQPLLVKAQGSSAVYYVYPSGRRKAYLTESVFRAYGHRSKDVVAVSQAQLATYPEVRVIKTRLQPTLYALSGGTVRPISSIDTFVNAGFRFDEVELVAPHDLAAYQLGQPL